MEASAFTAGRVLSSTTAESLLPQSQSPTAIYTQAAGFTYAGQRFHVQASGTATFPSSRTDYVFNMYVLLGGSVQVGNIALQSNNVLAPAAGSINISAFGQQGQQISITEATTAAPTSWFYEMWGTCLTTGGTGTLGWSAKMTTTMFLSSERVLLAPAQFVTVSSGGVTAPYNVASSQTIDLWGAFANVVSGPTLQLQDYEFSLTL